MKNWCFALLILSSSTAHGQNSDHTLHFELKVADTIEITKCRGYISSLKVNYSDDSYWFEHFSYHLLDFTDSNNNYITFPVDSAKSITSFEYTIGTDSLVNISGVYTGDLDPILGMYWAWNSGYINFKLEGNNSQTAFSYHVGGYVAPYATARRVTHLIDNDDNLTAININIDDIINSNIGKELPSLMSPGSKSFEMASIIAKAFQLNE